MTFPDPFSRPGPLNLIEYLNRRVASSDITNLYLWGCYGGFLWLNGNIHAPAKNEFNLVSHIKRRHVEAKPCFCTGWRKHSRLWIPHILFLFHRDKIRTMFFITSISQCEFYLLFHLKRKSSRSRLKLSLIFVFNSTNLFLNYFSSIVNY